jgi:hypothetical protein
MSFTEKCNEIFRTVADKSALIDAFDDLTPQQKENLKAEVASKMAKEPHIAGRIASEYVVNSYVSGPGTIAVNALSASTQMFLQPLLREIEAAMPRSLTRGDRISGEGVAMLRGIMQGFSEAMAFAKQGFVSGRPLDINMSAQAFGMSEAKFQKFINENFISEERAAMLRADMYDINNKAIGGTLGEVVRAPTRVGIFIDEFNKAIFRRMEFNAVAYREAARMAKQTGDDAGEIYSKLTKDRLTVDNWQQQITQRLGGSRLWDVQNFAKEAVFQEKLTGFAADVAKRRADYPLLALIVPFVKTPYNIIKEGVSYIPGLGLLNRKQVGKGERFDFAFNIPEQRGKIMAKQALGIGVAVALDSAVNQGLITGSDPKDGRPPFSIKIGDEWYGYQRVEPLATVFGMAVDSSDLIKKYKEDLTPEQDKDISKYLGAYAKAVQANIFEKSFMEGLSKALFAMTDPERYGSGFLNQYANALVPAIAATTAKVLSPTEREAQTFMEKAQSRIPGMREELPIKYTKTGEPEQASLANALLGIKVTTPTAIEKQLSDIQVDIVGASKRMGGVELNTEQYARYKEISGKVLADSLSQVFNNQQFKDSDKYTQQFVVNKIVSMSRSAATKQLTMELYQQDPDFSRKWYNEYIKKHGAQESVGFRQQ